MDRHLGDEHMLPSTSANPDNYLSINIIGWSNPNYPKGVWWENKKTGAHF